MTNRACVIVRDGVVIEQYQTQEVSEADRLIAAGAVDISGASPLPQCGWTYAGGVFTAPPQVGGA